MLENVNDNKYLTESEQLRIKLLRTIYPMGFNDNIKAIRNISELLLFKENIPKVAYFQNYGLLLNINMRKEEETTKLLIIFSKYH